MKPTHGLDGDERTPEEYDTHSVIVLATDSFMSGWGQAQGRKSYAGWACRPEDARRVLKWVESRPEMKRVRVVGKDYRNTSDAHCHIYVVREGHSSLCSHRNP